MFSTGGENTTPAQHRAPLKMKTAPDASPDFRDCIRCGSPKLGWDPASGYLVLSLIRPFLVRSASYFSSPETPDNYRYL